jgi:hypothetical protein
MAARPRSRLRGFALREALNRNASGKMKPDSAKAAAAMRPLAIAIERAPYAGGEKEIQPRCWLLRAHRGLFGSPRCFWRLAATASCVEGRRRG